jgi:uncharacterized membrane protein YdjX (TVP38/TMEM64 family)
MLEAGQDRSGPEFPSRDFCMKHWWLLLLLALLAGLFFGLDLGRFLSLESLKDSRDELQRAYETRPFHAIALYVATYILIAALSLPGAAVMTLAGGAIFGLWVGVPAALFSASIGATLALWLARYVFRDAVQRRFGDRLEVVNAGIARDGAMYLFTLRLVPLFPFFIINLLMGLTAISTVTFFWASLFGMLASTMVYVNAGTQLATITSISDILSPAIIGSLLLLAVFPWVARGIVTLARRKRTERR